MKATLQAAGVIVALFAGICCLSSMMGSLDDMFAATPHIWPAIGAAVVVALGAAGAWSAFLSWRAQREKAAWTAWERAGTDGPWPWSADFPQAGLITPLAAWSGWVDSLAVKAGEFTWSADALAGMTGTSEGTGAFVCVRLPRSLPPAAVHVRSVAAGKTFDDRFNVQGPGRHLVGDVLRIVHVENTIPPWTILGDELFAFARLTEPVRPRHIQDLAQRAAWVVQLLLLEDARPRA
ncbi:hypothetical protein [Actinoplanes sp. NPDC051494]|uniref:hypothetical protein n=1 Tax=Actinoplanes sp. NPDC051494 TaxID=3363907 RepID=UPI00379FF7D2